jgi:ankyrin repeat domain-containing protein 50
VLLAAGSGKTFLTSRVIDQVRSTLNSTVPDEAVAMFYCNRVDPAARGTSLSVLRSLVRQLSTRPGDLDHIHPKIEALHHTTRATASDLNIELCKDLILELVNLYPRTTIILDALDECDLASRRQILDTLAQVVDESSKPVRVFISSRPDVDIRNSLGSRHNVEISAVENTDDIAKFVHQEIAKHPKWADMDATLKVDIVSTLLAKSDGM